MILLIIVLAGIARNLKSLSHMSAWLKRDISIPDRIWEMSTQN